MKLFDLRECQDLRLFTHELQGLHVEQSGEGAAVEFAEVFTLADADGLDPSPVDGV